MSEMRIDPLTGRDVASEPSPKRLRFIAPSAAERPSGSAAALVLLVVVPLLYLTLLLGDATFSWLIREEHPIEGLGALSLLASSIACFVLWRRVRDDDRWPALRRLSLLALAVLFLFGFGEEISWGQRILGLETPESLQAANAQNETNVHNLQAFGGVLDMDGLFQLFWLMMGVVIPVLALWRVARRPLERLIPILPLALAPLFVLNQLLTRGFYEMLSANPDLYHSTRFGFEHGIFEIKETVSCLLLATGFWVLVLRQKRAPDHGTEQR
jgi:hypothetical protein